MSDLDDRLTEEANPFDQFSPAEVYAYIHKKLGEGALRELLARPIKGVVRTKEDWLDISAELQAAGLSKVAAIVSEFAAAALPMTDMSFCCYTKPPHDPNYRPNIVAWQRDAERRQSERELKRQGFIKTKPKN